MALSGGRWPRHRGPGRAAAAESAGPGLDELQRMPPPVRRPVSAPARVVRVLAALALVTPTALLAASLPAPVVERGYELRKVGGGELRWLGMSIYDASLWTSSGRYRGFGPGETVALSLWYQRSFSRDELIRITDTAWRRLGNTDGAQRERWLAELKRSWSDVAPGQNVTTVVIPNGPTRFYDQSGRFAEIADPAFGPAFLSIWLDPRSVVSDLRIRLIGGREQVDTTAAN